MTDLLNISVRIQDKRPLGLVREVKLDATPEFARSSDALWAGPVPVKFKGTAWNGIEVSRALPQQAALRDAIKASGILGIDPAKYPVQQQQPGYIVLELHAAGDAPSLRVAAPVKNAPPEFTRVVDAVRAYTGSLPGGTRLGPWHD